MPTTNRNTSIAQRRAASNDQTKDKPPATGGKFAKTSASDCGPVHENTANPPEKRRRLEQESHGPREV
jgi:hypothetical protein